MNHHDPEKHNPSDLQRAETTIAGELLSETAETAFEVFGEQKIDHVLVTARYELLEEIGHGGVGIIYRAVDRQLQRLVAIKILRPEFIDRPDVVRRFIDESLIMGTLQHPGIAHVYNSGACDDGRPFHAMMLVTGQTLSSMLDGAPPNGWKTQRLLNVFAQVCSSMAYTHSRGVVHLDLKPGNVMVGDFGEAYLMDWGLARMHVEIEENRGLQLAQQEPIKQRQVQGTLEYMSPEQAQGGLLDQRTDVFCLGAMLYEILTGVTIYRANTRKELLRCALQASNDAAFERLERCHIAQPLIRLVKKCLATDPQDRPLDATVLAAELASYQASQLETVQNDMTRFFELSLDLFCIADFDGYFRRINSNFSRVLGYSDQELLARPFADFVHVDDRAKTREIMGVLLDGQPVVQFTNRYLASNGEYLNFEWTAKSILEEKLIFAVARNLSEQR